MVDFDHNREEEKPGWIQGCPPGTRASHREVMPSGTYSSDEDISSIQITDIATNTADCSSNPALSS